MIVTKRTPEPPQRTLGVERKEFVTDPVVVSERKAVMEGEAPREDYSGGRTRWPNGMEGTGATSGSFRIFSAADPLTGLCTGLCTGCAGMCTGLLTGLAGERESRAK